MKFRQLGWSGMKVSVFSYGGWLTLGHSERGEQVKELMKAAFDMGINLFDTAEGYANGQSEIDMGNAIKELGWKREEVVINTKIFFGTGRKDPNEHGLSRKHIIEGLNESLRRLQLDYVDVVHAHRDDPDVSMEEIVRAFNHCIDTGKALYWGTSEWTAARLQEAFDVAERLGLQKPLTEQPEYSLFARERFEKEYAPIFAKYKLGSTIWSPLASGVLTGKYNDGIPKGSRYDTHSAFFTTEIEELKSPEGKKKIEKVKKLTAIAERLNVSTAAVALAWAALQPNVSTVILGATKVKQLQDNLQALEVMDKIAEGNLLDEINRIFNDKSSL